MRDVLENIAGGFLAAIAFSAVRALWQWMRQPMYLPMASRDWSPQTRQLLDRAGYTDGAFSWVTDIDREAYRERRSTELRVGRWPRRREVRNRSRDGGFTVLMRRPD